MPDHPLPEAAFEDVVVLGSELLMAAVRPGRRQSAAAV